VTNTGTHRKILINRKILLFFTKPILPYKATHVHNTQEVFPVKCWAPSDDGHRQQKHVKALLYY
jgi:hypothetical protein